MVQRLVVGISGATGVVYGVRVLELLRNVPSVETHLVMTRHGELTLALETDFDLNYVRGLADVAYSPSDLGATIASGSFVTHGMIVAPCSIKSLSGIANAYEETLLIRAAGVHLKERRPLALMVRESPLHLGHLRLLVAAAEMGATIVPPLPSFYTRPETLDDVVDQTVGRVLDLFGVEAGVQRWRGTREVGREKRGKGTPFN